MPLTLICKQEKSDGLCPEFHQLVFPRHQDLLVSQGPRAPEVQFENGFRPTSSFTTEETEIQRIWSALYKFIAQVSGRIGSRSPLTVTPLLFQDKINSIYIAKWTWGPSVPKVTLRIERDCFFCMIRQDFIGIQEVSDK